MFRVFYDGNGSISGLVPTVKCEYEDSVTIAAEGNLVRTGYTFIEWNTAANGSSGTKYAPGAKFKMGAGPVTLYAQWKNPAGMVKIAAKGATFSMGDALSTPMHQVTFTKDFWMDTTEVTQAKYQALMAATYSGYTSPLWSSIYGVGDNNPAYYVNWYDAVLYCNARTKVTGSTDTVYLYTSIPGTPGNDCTLDGLSINLSKSGFRLPTEAQWEYACRAGTTTDFYWGKDYDPYPSTVVDSNEVDGYAVWYRNSYLKGSGNPDYGTHLVATKLKNPVGLYDMSGNVWEWCHDWYESYGSLAQTDPVGPATGSGRVLRGGSWDYGTIYLHSAYRRINKPDGAYYAGGFRVCLPAQ